MPKLTQAVLKKKYICPYCDKPTSTKQGLSGHIQFKHPTGKKPWYTEPDQLIEAGKRFKKICEAADISPNRIRNVLSILTKWVHVRSVCDIFKINLGGQDFKLYLLISLAYGLQNEELIKELANINVRILEEYVAEIKEMLKQYLKEG